MLHIISTILLFSGVTIDTSIGIGSIVNVLVILIGFVASWYKMESKTEGAQKEITSTGEVVRKLGEQIQLLSLTAERLSTLSEINERRWDAYDRNV